PAPGLLQDLDRRRLVVGPPVVLVAVLVAEEVVVGIGLVTPAHLAKRLVVTEERVREDEPRAVREHALLALDTRVVGNHALDGDAVDERLDSWVPGHRCLSYRPKTGHGGILSSLASVSGRHGRRHRRARIGEIPDWPGR